MMMRLSRHFFAVAFAAAALLAHIPAWAVDEVESRAEQSGDMPQMNTAFFPSQIFWLVITFGILYFLLKRFAVPAVERTQTKRSKLIADQLAAANTANEEAKKIITAYEKTLVDARAEAQAAVTDLTRQAAITAMDKQAEQQKALTARLHEAETRIASARDAALRDAEAAVADIAGTALEKIAGMKLAVKS